MRTARIRATGTAAVYRCSSRVLGGQIFLDMTSREKFAEILGGLAALCRVEIITYCIMIDHFEILLRVPRKARLADSELLKRMTVFYGEHAGRTLLARQSLHEHGRIDQKLRISIAGLMGDVSLFMKEFKQRFSRWYNQYSGRDGPLWAERFKSVLVEDAPAPLQETASQIDLHPVRAGLVRDPMDYRFCGYSAALGGAASIQRGLAKIMRKRNWAAAAPEYRKRLFSDERHKQFSTPIQ